MTRKSELFRPNNTQLLQARQNKSIEKIINKIICGDALKLLQTISSESVDCVVMSPPYWALRDYGVAGQIGLEENFNSILKNYY